MLWNINSIFQLFRGGQCIGGEIWKKNTTSNWQRLSY